jgi:hypothetical protein
MGKLLKYKDGKIVSIAGAPVLERTLMYRKEKGCDDCGFKNWTRGDTCFIVNKPKGGMQRLCPDCACSQATGLPREYYKKNAYANPRSPFDTTDPRSLFDATDVAEYLTLDLLDPLGVCLGPIHS